MSFKSNSIAPSNRLDFWAQRVQGKLASGWSRFLSRHATLDATLGRAGGIGQRALDRLWDFVVWASRKLESTVGAWMRPPGGREVDRPTRRVRRD